MHAFVGGESEKVIQLRAAGRSAADSGAAAKTAAANITSETSTSQPAAQARSATKIARAAAQHLLA
jgi:hypothetical protein